MRQKITIILGILLLFIAACNNVSFINDGEDLVCVPKDNITQICEQERVKTLNEMALNATLNESEINLVIIEGQTLDLNVTAIDPDGDLVFYNFSSPFDTNGVWETKVGDVGYYKTTVLATDGEKIVEKNLTIYVKKRNSLPVIIIEDIVEFNEGENMVLPFNITDEDGDEVVYTISGWMYGSRYPLDFNSAGVYNVTITGNDGKESVEKTITAIINDVNRAPEVISLQSIEVVEGDTVTVNGQGRDPDGDSITVSYGEPLDENGVWITRIGDEGEHQYSVTVSDGDLQTTESFDIIVLPANKAPILEEIEDVVVSEGEQVRFTPIAYDPEGNEITTTYSGWMSTNTYTTTYTDAGEYIVTITVSDGEQESFQHVKVTVVNVNRAPVFIN